MSIQSGSTESFGPNWIRVTVLVIAAALGYAFAQELDPSRASFPAWGVHLAKVSLVAVPVILLCWLLSVRLSIDPVGIRYRSLLGSSEMRWDEVDALYSGAAITLLYGVIPIGTRYHFKLKAGASDEERIYKIRHLGKVKLTTATTKRSSSTREISFGSRFSKPDRISRLLDEFTFPVLWRKVTAAYNGGRDVSFGDFRISKQGIKVDLLGVFPDDLAKKPIPWSDVRSYSVDKCTLTLTYYTTKANTAKRGVADIQNFRVFMALLQQIKSQPVSSAASEPV